MDEQQQLQPTQPQPLQPTVKTNEQMHKEFQGLIVSLVAELDKVGDMPTMVKRGIKPLIKMILAELSPEMMPEFLDNSLQFLEQAYVRIEAIRGLHQPPGEAIEVQAAPARLELGAHTIEAVTFIENAK